jgi:hypothetical protein
MADTVASASLPVVAVLGDSRVFDTYYTNDSYPERYGYNATFPFLLAREALRQAKPYEVVHIPDHFRGGTVENNIIRLALTDPAIVVLCDGIWETLVSKDWTVDGQKIEDTRVLADRFIANQLAVSPRRYAEKQRRIISYFRRRRRQCVWLSLPMPPREHLNRLHYAGNYRCIPEWDECLNAINEAMAPVVTAYDALWLDLHKLVGAVGGFSQALIDQWHFSKAFHARIASSLSQIVESAQSEFTLVNGHASRGFMMARALGEEPVVLVGSKDRLACWRRDNTAAKVESEVVLTPSIDVSCIAKSSARAVVLADGTELPLEAETMLLRALPREKILLYPAELGPIDNPVGADKAQHGVLR